jgi:hypothetical protein
MKNSLKKVKEEINWQELGKQQVEALLHFDTHSEIFRQSLESFRGRLLIGDER